MSGVIEQEMFPDLVDYLICLAKSDRNPDMQGYAVRLSTFVSNLCVAILIAYSNEDVFKSVKLIMLQSFVILVCSSIALGNKELSISDAHFALTLTISPVSMYFVYSTYRYLRRRPNHLYSRLGAESSTTSQLKTCILTITMLVYWIVFEVLLWWIHTYKDGKCIPKSQGLLFYKIFALIIAVLFSGPLMALIPIFWIIYFFRHFKDIRGEYRRHMGQTERWGRFRWLQTIGRPVKVLVISQWDVIARSHTWIFGFTILIFYITWGSALLLLFVNVRYFYFYVVVRQFKPDEKWVPGGSDESPFRSYGQLLATAMVIEPLWDASWLIFYRRHNILSWFRRCPGSIWNGVVFIFTGRRNPWKKLQKEHDRSNVEAQKIPHLYARMDDDFDKESVDFDESKALVAR